MHFQRRQLKISVFALKLLLGSDQPKMKELVSFKVDPFSKAEGKQEVKKELSSLYQRRKNLPHPISMDRP